MGPLTRAVMLCLGITALDSASAQVKTPTESPAQHSGIVEGVVLDARSGNPLPGRIVSLYAIPAASTHFPMRDDGGVIITGAGPGFGPVMADAAGRFQFLSVPAGWYSLSIYGRGTGQYGQASPTDPPRMFQLSQGQRRTGLRLRVFADPIVSGRVVDEAGRPVIGVPVIATPAIRTANDRTGQSQTDDRGIYSLTLPPGEYLVAAKPPPIRSSDAILAAPANGRRMIYPSTYHPAGSSIPEAALVTVRSGDDMSGLDIRMAPVAAYTVTTTFPQAVSKGIAHLDLLRANESDAAAAVREYNLGAGRMVLSGVQAGAYELRALISPPMPMQSHGIAALRTLPSEPTLWTRHPITIGDRDLAVSLNLQHGVRISGSVIFDGDQPPTMERLSSQVIVVEDGTDPNVDLRGLFTSTSSFTTIQLPPGAYMIRSSAPQDWHLKSITADGRDVMDTTIDVGSHDVNDVRITFTNRPARVAGTVTLDGTAEPLRPWVTVFPAEPALWKHVGVRPARLARVLTGVTGNYEATLPPGTYLVAATTGPVRIPQDLGALAAIAQTVVLVEGLAVTQNLPAARRIR